MQRPPPLIDHNIPPAVVGKAPASPENWSEMPVNAWGPFTVETADGGRYLGCGLRFDWSFGLGQEQVQFSVSDGVGDRLYTVTSPPVETGDTVSFETAEHGLVTIRPVVAADVTGALSDDDARRQAARYFGLPE